MNVSTVPKPMRPVTPRFSPFAARKEKMKSRLLQPRWLQLAALVWPLLFSSLAHAQFVAFNDHAPGTIGVTTHSNATTWNIFGNAPGASGALKDINSGTNLPVTVTITRTGTINTSSTAGNPGAGTPLYNTFNGYVDFQGAGNSDAAGQVVGVATVTYTFTGLNPNKTYSFKGSAVRGGSGGTYPQRWSLFEIDGAAAFTSAHTSGGYTNGLAANQVAINTGINTNGVMADWENIVPGASGSFSVMTTQYTNTIPGGGTANGPYGYALSGLRLQEFESTNISAPTVLAATNSGNHLVQVVFSIPVQAAGATNAANYSLTNSLGNVPVLSAAFGTNNQTIQLTTASQLPFAAHRLMVNGVADAATGLQIIATNSQIVFTNIGFTAGYVQRQLYFNITGTTVASLTNNAAFPGNPGTVDFPPSMGWPLENITNNYGGRMFGWLIPPLTGQYFFAVESDDNSQLFLSTNDSPASKVLLSQETSYGGSFDSHASVAITLTAGQKYYIEGLMKEGGGGDYFYVAWKMPTNMAWTVIPGQFLGNFLTGTNASVTISQQPANTSVMAGQSATFTVAATGGSSVTASVSCQWQLNGFDLVGANGSSYTTPPLAQTNSGAVYRAVVSVPGKAQFSSNAVLTVTADNVPPTVAQIFNIGPTNVQIVFSEPVEAVSATNIANYVFTNGVSVTSAAFAGTNTTILLTTAPLVYGSNYSIVINGVRDQAVIPNLITTNTLASFLATQYAAQDIGSALIPSVVTVAGNGVNVAAAGNDLGGLADQFSFQYQLRTGDFDVTARLAGLGLSDLWAKAGLIARETLDASSRFAASVATPGMNGAFFEYRDPAYTPGISTGNFPVNYPNTWLRLKRAGNVFTGFASYDGLNWTPLGSATISMPAQIYFGLFVSSRSGSQPTTAQFRDVADTSANAIVSTVTNPHEPLGPSSRKSPIAISEIMYKPAPRMDGRNLEFFEIYNSNPFFHDISSYQVVADNLSYMIPPNTIIPGGGFMVIAASPTDIASVYGVTNVLGPYTGSLKKAGTIQLLDEVGAVLLTVPYSNLYPWPFAADGTGHSIVLANPTYGEEDPRAWDISDVAGGSPGAMEAFHPSPLRSVVINEILAHSENSSVPDFVELYNHSNQTNDLSGGIITDDTATNKFVIPPGTLIAPRGFVSFDQSQLGFAPAGSGATIYFIQPDNRRILDAVQFEAQADGVSLGRWPDGASAFYPMNSRTPGTSNSPVLIGDIVINELMYDPITGNDDDQYLELYNQGTNTVNLANWQFTAGITFSFPANTTLATNAYLVIARNLTNLFAKYPNLNSANTLGNFGGRLSHNGERVTLAMPQILTSTNSHGLATNIIYVVEDEVTYGTGGRWGQWSAGGGSSLELMDPRANHRLAANWGDSDETHKSSWINIENTGVLDLGKNYDPSIDYAQIGILDVGECLVDNLEVHSNASPVNLVANPDFESGATNWTFQGCEVRSSLENEGYSSSRSLHIRCGDRVWPGDNSCEMALATNKMVSGQTATLRFKARWLRGWPEVLLRLNGNWLEAAGALPVPPNLGTPGAANSRYATNAGPAVYEVSHSPAVPTTNQPVIVTARVHDSDGVQNLTLNYRIDPSMNYISVPMKDDGTGGDALANDGIFSGTIPAPVTTSNAIVAFYISATDPRAAATRFPALLNNNGIPPECVVMFGDSNPSGSFSVYHLWLTQTNATRWAALSDLSNESWDCTMVNNSRIIYNAQARFAGSPYHQGFDTPYGSLCHYKWIFPDDDKFLGATSFNKLHQPGNGAGDDTSLQREQMANSFLRTLGVPWLNRRYVAVYVNGNRRGTLMEDAQCPDGDVVKEHFPNDPDGWLYKMQPWFEFGPAPGAASIAFANNAWCTLVNYTTTGGVKKTARYRWNFELRRTPGSYNDLTNVYSLIDAANSFNSPNYIANMENLADMENWMRVFAANHAAGNWDSFGAQNSQNLYGYLGALGTKYSLLMWDFNITFGNSGSWSPGANLFTVSDAITAKLFSAPTFRRMYWRALQELINGPLNVANSGPVLDAKYNSFVANGQSVENPSANIKPWLTSARNSITTQLAVENTTNFFVNPNVILSNDVAYVSGTAPVNVDTIWINGAAWPLTWTTTTNWTATIPLQPGTNALSVVGVDTHNQPVPGDTTNLTVIYNGTLPSPAGQLVINEIMYHPSMPNAQFVELYNNSTNTAFDLSGWDFKGLSYTFPSGSLIAPNSFLVLVANAPAFAAAYGATKPVFGIFSGTLQTDGETLSLVQPGINIASDVIVAKVKYGSGLPWPTNANGAGSSLQLLDPQQDNWRAGNWSSAAATPGATNFVFTNLPPFAPLWLNELQADNLTGITNRTGQRTAWLELYNPSTNVVVLTNLFLANNYTNLTAWSFPTNAIINAGEFKIIFADGQTNLATTNELHTSFTLPSGAGSLALSRLNNGQPQVLDYIDYAGLGVNHSYGSFPDGQSFTRQDFFYPTPGRTNDVTGAPLTVFINEWMAGNTHTLQDPLDSNKYDDWFELYNPSSNTVNLAGCFLTNNLSSTLYPGSQIPAGYTIPPQGFLLVWADKKTPSGSGDLHVNFKLNKGGTSIALYNANSNLVDYVTFGAQTSDISEGRYPDGAATRFFMPTATPRTNNIVPNTAPVWNVINNQIVVLGQTMSLNASATDADFPVQILTFSLGTNAPAGAAVNSFNGHFTWTPTMAPATNFISLIVTDNGTPSLSATQSFTVTVTLPPQLGGINLGGNQLIFTWPSYAGLNYQLEYTDDLTIPGWTPLGNPLAGTGAAMSVTNSLDTSSQRFFRLRLLP